MNVIAKGGSSTIVEEFFVIPGQTEATIKYTVSFYDNDRNLVEKKENQVLSLFPNQTQWEANNIYKYQVNLPASPQKITFNVVEVAGWEIPTNVPLDGKIATIAAN